MFGNMFDKIKKKDLGKEGEDSVFTALVASWNLTDIKTYLQNKNPDFPMNAMGVETILNRFTTRAKPDKKYVEGKRMVDIDDNDIRVKKAFDIILLLSKNTLLQMQSVEKMERFRILHEDVIEKFDKQNAQTYSHKLKEAIANAIILVEAKKGIENSLNVRHKGIN